MWKKKWRNVLIIIRKQKNLDEPHNAEYCSYSTLQYFELAYNIRRMNAQIEEFVNDKNILEKELGLLLTDFEYTLDKRDIDNGILEIFEKALLTNNN